IQPEQHGIGLVLTSDLYPLLDAPDLDVPGVIDGGTTLHAREKRCDDRDAPAGWRGSGFHGDLSATAVDNGISSLSVNGIADEKEGGQVGCRLTLYAQSLDASCRCSRARGYRAPVSEPARADRITAALRRAAVAPS